MILRNQIQKIEPDLIITHSHNDYHPDHRNLSKLAKDASNFDCPFGALIYPAKGITCGLHLSFTQFCLIGSILDSI